MNDISSPSPTAQTISWRALEFQKKERHPDWLWYAGLAFGIAAVLSFFYGNIFFGIFLVVAGVVLIVYAIREPKLLDVTLTPEHIDIKIGDLPHTTIAYEKIREFSLDETGKPDKLLVRVEGSFVPVISLPLEGVSADSIRTYLNGKIKEGNLRESNSVKLFDRMGF